MSRILMSLAMFVLAAGVEAANFSGKISKIGTRTFTVRRGTEVKEFLVTSETQLERGGKRARLQEFNVGDAVTVVFREEGGRAVAEWVSAGPEVSRDRPHARE